MALPIIPSITSFGGFHPPLYTPIAVATPIIKPPQPVSTGAPISEPPIIVGSPLSGLISPPPIAASPPGALGTSRVAGSNAAPAAPSFATLLGLGAGSAGGGIAPTQGNYAWIFIVILIVAFLLLRRRNA